MLHPIVAYKETLQGAYLMVLSSQANLDGEKFRFGQRVDKDCERLKINS